MNSSERAEFDKRIAILCAGYDVPATDERKEAYWLALNGMRLSDFVRTVEHVLADEHQIRMPKPGAIWAISKRLRASGPEKPIIDDGFLGDSWDGCANRHLLAHLMRLTLRKAAKYSREETLMLVSAKNSWAADMRDIAAHNGGDVDVKLQKDCWADLIGRAELEIARSRAVASVAA